MDQAVLDLSEEQLREVLDQIIDHNRRDSEKCALVRRLNAEDASKNKSSASKDESSAILEYCYSATQAASSGRGSARRSRHNQIRANRIYSKEAEFGRSSVGGNNSKKVQQFTSLQDLASPCLVNSDHPNLFPMRAFGANRKKFNKDTRANSFCSTASQSFCNKEVESSLTSASSTASNSIDYPFVNTNSSNKILNCAKIGRNNKVKSQKQFTNISTSSTYSESNSSSGICDESNMLEDSASSLYENEFSASTFNSACESRTRSQNIICDTIASTSSCNTTFDSDVTAEIESEEITSIEMKDLGNPVVFQEYRSEEYAIADSQNHSVDSTIGLSSYLHCPKVSNPVQQYHAEKVIHTESGDIQKSIGDGKTYLS